ncbi:MAG: Do family serine endopeptidase [Beijerinckiaceae bacterium]|nr:Do family serine endopeptidase [Beijerinckiaceae bacterium]
MTLTSRCNALAAGLIAVGLFGSALGVSAETVREVPRAKSEELLSFAPVVRKAAPAVVNVYASRIDTQPRNPLFDDPVFRHFFGDNGSRPGGVTAKSLGSGVIVDSSGLIVTNFHVIEGMTDVKVALSDRRELDADIVLRDQRTDLAVLKVKGGGTFPAMELGDSDALEVGDIALAIGDPFGVGQTVTQGIISALARTNIGTSDYGFFIQTDAAINPGNSGGALVDLQARLVGINSAIFSQSGGSIGIGFAIPVNMVKVVVAAAKTGDKQVRRPWLGASLQAVTPDIADSLGLARPSGVLVAELNDKGPAAEAGIKRGDVITEIDGKIVDNPEGFGFRLATKPLGGNADVTLNRDGKVIHTVLNLRPAPSIPARDLVKIGGGTPFSGISAVNLSPAVAEELSLNDTKEGVVILDVDPQSYAARINFKKGDVLLSINDKSIKTTKDLKEATTGQHYYWKLIIDRGGNIVTTVLGG